MIGRNGRGKTTLLHLLRQKLVPTRGHVENPLGTCYFPFVPENSEQTAFAVIKDSIAPFRFWESQMQELTADATEENLLQYSRIADQYEELDGYRIDARIHREAMQMGLDEGLLMRSFATLSGGEQTRALIIAFTIQINRTH